MSINLLPPYADAAENGPITETTGQFNIVSGDPHDTDYCEVEEACEECVTCAGDPCTSCTGNTHDTLQLVLADTDGCDGTYCLEQDGTDPCLYTYSQSGIVATVEYTGTGDSRQVEITVTLLGDLCAHAIINPITCDPRMGVLNDVISGTSVTPYLIATDTNGDTYNCEQDVDNPWLFEHDSGGNNIVIQWTNYGPNTWRDWWWSAYFQPAYEGMKILTWSGPAGSPSPKLLPYVYQYFPFLWIGGFEIPDISITTPNGTITVSPCCTPVEPPEDHPPAGNCCCDCQPDSLSLVISGATGIGAIANGSWTVTWEEDCLWTYTDADISIEVGKSGDTLTVIVHNIDEDEDIFSGSADCLCDNDEDCTGTCYQMNFDGITNSLIYGGAASVSGSCTPTIEGYSCAETWDCGDTPPCTGCCPNAIPTSLVISASGVTACGGCYFIGGQCRQVTGISITGGTLTREGGGICSYGGVGGTAIGTLTYSWGIPMFPPGPPFFGTCAGVCTNTGATTSITARVVGGAVFIYAFSANAVLFIGALDEGCTGVATNTGTSGGCGSISASGPMWVGYDGTVTAGCP